MENINEGRNSISTYIQCFTHQRLFKNIQEFCMTIQKREKLKIKTLIFEHKNNCLQKIKKGTSKVALC